MESSIFIYRHFNGTLVSSNEQILSFLKKSATTGEKSYEIVQLRLQYQNKKLALKEMDQKNKILLTILSSIDNNNTREFIRSEQSRIIQKEESNNNLLLHQISMDHILVILEAQDQIYVTINISVWIIICVIFMCVIFVVKYLVLYF